MTIKGLRATFSGKPFTGLLYILFFIGLIVLIKDLYFYKKLVLIDHALMEEGDLVFIKGHTIRSKLLYAFTNSDNFSHVGILIQFKNGLHVVHANPDKGSIARDAVISESIDDFVKNASPSFLLVLRMKRRDPTILKGVRQFILHYLDNHVRFDHSFLLSTDEYMYCTELIFKAFRSVGIDLTNGNFDYVDTPIVTGDVVLPESIINSSYFDKVLSICN